MGRDFVFDEDVFDYSEEAERRGMLFRSLKADNDTSIFLFPGSHYSCAALR